MPCKSTITPSEILKPGTMPAAYFENFARLRFQCENKVYFQSIRSTNALRSLNMITIERMEQGTTEHFEAVRRKNELFGVYDV
ncbi:hypothetical protein TWF481_002074 [Arthrobotrys musiformis]|uniref:Uncharacterized protein n=1 Tax=Arthrobotrys musiformis TaxID=47236 RepID=A0AAV9VUA6_9PEZI